MDASPLCALPAHVLARVLCGLDARSLCAVSQTCSTLLAAASDERLWAGAGPLEARDAGAPRPGVAAALAAALGAALRLPPPLLRPRVSLEPLSRFQAALSLAGLHAALELTRVGAPEAGGAAAAARPARAAPGEPADRWLLGLVASPAAALAAEASAALRAPCQRDELGARCAARAAAARGAVLCARHERAAVRLQLHPRFAVAAALRGAAAPAAARPRAPPRCAAADAAGRVCFWAHYFAAPPDASALAALLLPAPGELLRLSHHHLRRALESALDALGAHASARAVCVLSARMPCVSRASR
jgi:hypothetical protein